jgi:addiction module RelE/StbE family toxin
MKILQVLTLIILRKKVYKIFKKHRDLVPKFKKVIEKLTDDPFENSLKTHKLKGNLSEFYACSLTYQYRIVLTIEIKDKRRVRLIKNEISTKSLC